MKRSKKLLAFLTAGVMLAGLTACGGGSSTSSSATSEAASEAVSEAATSEAASEAPSAEAAASTETYKVYLITMDQMDQHWVNVDKGAKKASEELGNVEYRWFAPDVKDDAKQIEQVNNAVADGAQAIVIAANGPTAVTSSLEEASDQGVKIVYVDSPADFPAVKTFATDNVAAGKVAGEEMIKALEAKGVTSGTIGVVNVNAATQSTVDRETGFRSAFEGTDFEILETQYSDGDAAKSQQFAENYISQGVVGIFGANEGTTTGVGNAIKEDGNKVIGVGFDQSDTIKNLITEGSLLCTMAQNPDVMGYDGVKAAVAALDGSDPGDGSTVDTGVTVMNIENIG